MTNHGEVFAAHRPRLFAIAYRMLGTAADADDVVQEAFLRFQRTATADINSPPALLTTITTRLAIDQSRKLRLERERYAGPWLPEPLVTDPTDSPDQHAALAESLSIAMLVLLETLEPIERAVFLLREVFELDYAQIAQVVEKNQDHCRQLLHRARQRIAAGRPRHEASRDEQERLTARFIETCASGDLAGLMRLLADDVTIWSDGGGKVPAARRPVSGADAVARFMIGVAKKKPADVTVRQVLVNGSPGVVTYHQGQPTDVIQIEVADGRIVAVRVQRNPEKLARLGKTGIAPARHLE